MSPAPGMEQLVASLRARLDESAAERKLIAAYERWQSRADAGEELSEYERGTLAGLYAAVRILAKVPAAPSDPGSRG